MVLLDVDFNEGDILTAGVVTSTSSVNGITTTINSNTIAVLKPLTRYIGASTISSVANSTAELVIGTVTIPGNTVNTGIIISAAITAKGASAGNTSTFKIKSGATSSEALKQTIVLMAPNTNYLYGGSMLFYDDASNFSNEVTVLVTGTNASASASDICRCDQLVVTGY